MIVRAKEEQERHRLPSLNPTLALKKAKNLSKSATKDLSPLKGLETFPEYTD